MRRTPTQLFSLAAALLTLAIALPARAQFGSGNAADPSNAPPIGATPRPHPANPEDEATPHSLPQPETSTAQVTNTNCPGPRVVRVQFDGLQHVRGDEIRDVVRVREGSCFSRSVLQRDAHMLWDQGLFQDVQVYADNAEGGVLVRFALRERPTIRRVEEAGYENVELEKITEVVDIREGSVFSLSAVQRTAQKIKDLYAEQGYYLAEVRPDVQPVEGDDNLVDVTFRITEGPQVQVRSINFVGNLHISSDDLRNSMSTSQASFFSFLTNSGRFREEPFKNDIDMLHAVYYDRGYLTVEIDNPRVALSADRRFIDITIFVREGPRYKVGRVRAVEVDDNDREIEPLGGSRHLREMLHIEPGDYFSRSTIGRDILAVQTYYRDAGYASVEVTPDIQPRAEGEVVDIGVRIRRGPLTFIRRIVIRGNEKTSDRVIRREMMIYEGDRYSETGYQASRRRILQLGYFESVDLSQEQVPDHPDQIIINVEVRERPTGTFQIGAGFSSVESFIATAQIQQLNLFGRGQTLTFQAQFSTLRQIFALRFVEPYLFDSDWSMAVDLYNTLRVYTDFSRNATGGSLSLGYPLIGVNDLRLAVTYTGEAVSVTRRGNSALFGSTGPSVFANVPLANLFRNGFTSALGLSLILDTRDNRLYPTNGLYARAGVEVSDDPITGAQGISYVRWSGFARFYVPLLLGAVLKGNLTAGLITSRDPRGVPISERYFLGGILDVRGYRLRTIGPRLPINSSSDPNSDVVSNGVNIGGNAQLYYNLELEFPILEVIGVRGVLFTDGGNVFNLEGQYCNVAGALQDPSTRVINPCVHDPLALRYSWGVGLRWFSPLGLLRFEWGFPFNKLPYEESNVFEFTIGNFF